MLGRFPSGCGDFPTTQWSVILSARLAGGGQSREALTQLCQAYWPPLYTYLRKTGHPRDVAEDHVQGFFATFLEKNFLEKLDPEVGRFRSYLLGALKHYLSHERDRATARKRGGSSQPLPLELDTEKEERQYIVEPATDATPEKLYERRWALTLLDQVLVRLQADYEQAGKGERYRVLSAFLPGARSRVSYKQAAQRLEMSVDAVKIAIYRLRRRYRECLYQAITPTVSTRADVEDEIRHLLEVLGR